MAEEFRSLPVEFEVRRGIVPGGPHDGIPGTADPDANVVARRNDRDSVVLAVFGVPGDIEAGIAVVPTVHHPRHVIRVNIRTVTVVVRPKAVWHMKLTVAGEVHPIAAAELGETARQANAVAGFQIEPVFGGAVGIHPFNAEVFPTAGAGLVDLDAMAAGVVGLVPVDVQMANLRK